MRILSSALLLFVFGVLALAGTSGKIAGVVKSPEGEPMVGVNVFVEGLELGAATDEDGYFFILNVPPGNHALTAQYIGYKPVTMTEVFVRVDHTTEANFTLESDVLKLGEGVTVEATRPDVERDVTFTNVNVNDETIALLPVTTVNEVLSLQAGVVNTGAIHVRGGRSGELAYFIDGNRVEDPLFGGNPTDVNTRAIQQLELITGTFNAEYGNAQSGVVNIVTKENFEKVSGDVRYRVSNLGLEEASNTLNSRLVEGYLNGPLIPGSGVGFLLSGKLDREDDYYQSGRLSADGIPSGEFSGDAFGYDNLTSLFAKVYFRPFNAAKLSLSYNYNDREWRDYVHSYKYIPDSTYERFRESHLFALNFSHTLSPKLFYELRLSYYDYSFLKTYADLFYTDYTAASSRRYNGEFRLTAGNEEYIDQQSKTFTGKLDAIYQYNRYHLFKAGVELQQHEVDYFWIFGPQRLPANRYINDYDLKPYEGAVYLQDKIEFESIVLNAGLRWDFYHPQVNYIADPNNRTASQTDAGLKSQLSPRLGIAYPLTERMVFHFAYGHFLQRPTFEVLYEDLSRNLDVNKPLIGNPDLEPRKTQSYELGVNARIAGDFSLQSTVFSKKIRNQIGVAWVFKEAGVLNQYAYYTNEDFASAKGFEISPRWRYGRFNLGGNYTYQIAEGSSSSQEERFTGAFDVKGRQSLQFYPLDFDQTHVVNAYLSLNFRKQEGPFGKLAPVFENTFFTLLFQYGSGLPFTFNPTRKRYEPDLNNARQPATYNFDLKAEKRFAVGPARMGLLLEVYNLLNRENVRGVYSVTGLPDDSGEPQSAEYVNDPTLYFAPRAVFLGLTLEM